MYVCVRAVSLGVNCLVILSLIYIDGQGVRLGSFRTLQHQVRGDVFAIDEKTIRIENFRYDGTGISKLINQ